MKKLTVLVLLLFIITSCSSVNDETYNALQTNLDMQIETNSKLNYELSESIDQLTLTEDKLSTSNSIIEGLKAEKAELEADVMTLEEKVVILEIEVEEEIETLGPTPGLPLLLEATNVMQAIVTEDFATLSLYVTITDGLRLTPYQFVDITNDIVLSQSEVANWMTLPTSYTWGSYDGSGDPITKTPDLYFDEFVKDEDFILAPLVGNNVILSSGNLINNIVAEYPGTSLVEFYYPEFNPIYEGLDWKSLTLVMKNISGEWYLVGIVHGQWTT